jgi:hypothetical protein
MAYAQHALAPTSPAVGISVWKSGCMDQKKTGNRTEPNCGPVHVAAVVAAVLDWFGCQLCSLNNIYRPGKNWLQLVYNRFFSMYITYLPYHLYILHYRGWACPSKIEEMWGFIYCLGVHGPFANVCMQKVAIVWTNTTPMITTTTTTLSHPRWHSHPWWHSHPQRHPFNKWPHQWPCTPSIHPNGQHLWLQMCHIMCFLHVRQWMPMLEKAPTDNS